MHMSFVVYFVREAGTVLYLPCWRTGWADPIGWRSLVLNQFDAVKRTIQRPNRTTYTVPASRHRTFVHRLVKYVQTKPRVFHQKFHHHDCHLPSYRDLRIQARCDTDPIRPAGLTRWIVHCPFDVTFHPCVDCVDRTYDQRDRHLKSARSQPPFLTRIPRWCVVFPPNPVCDANNHCPRYPNHVC